MRSQLEAIVKELKRLKREGVDSVYVEESTLDDLRSLVDGPAEVEHASPPPPTTSSGYGASAASPLGLGGGVAGARRGHVVLSQKGVPIAPIPESPPRIELPKGEKKTRWEALREQVLNDPVCLEHLNPGAQVVFGVGDIDADIFFCGEAPGSDEEKRGEPFVGKAGELLTRIIGAMGLKREQVYIGNIMNWRPEMPTPVGNRPPSQKEMSYCLPYLRAQIEVVQPKIVVALGLTAVNGLLGPAPRRRMGAMRGKQFSIDHTPLLVTYHPSYLLRNTNKQTKRLVWEDMLKVMEHVGLPITEKQRRYFQ